MKINWWKLIIRDYRIIIKNRSIILKIEWYLELIIRKKI